MKTPKQKAKELVNAMWLKIPARYTPIQEQKDRLESKTDDMSIAKQCALTCVDEIINLNCVWVGKGSPAEKDFEEDATLEYWQSVKKELELLK